MFKLISIFLFPIIITAQVTKVPDGYFIPDRDMVAIEYLARKASQCDTIVSEADNLIAQVTSAKIAADSINIQLDKKIKELNAKYNDTHEELVKANYNYQFTLGNITALKEENSRLRKKTFWATLSGVVLSAGGLLLLLK